MHQILVESIATVFALSVVPMLAISCGAGLVSMFQVVTQIQEQSISHLTRVLIMLGLITWGGSHAFDQIERLFVRVISLAAH